MKQSTAFKSVVDLMAKLKTDSDCRTYLKRLLWKSETPLGCPRCGDTATYSFKDGRTYKCAGCRQKFNLLTGTIFENTKLPLNKWIACIWMATSYKRGISSYQVARNLGVTQKTAWFMMQRIRKLYEQLKVTQLEGIVACDETFVGGKNANRHADKKFDYKGKDYRKSKFPDKISVFGAMEVGGKVISISVPDVKMSSLQPAVIKYVKAKSTVMTDEHHGYQYLHHRYKHMICNHSESEYVAKDGATTNPIENYWSHVKRAVIGTYYKMTPKHIDRYLAEFDFKFNYRELHDGEKFNLVLSQSHNTRLTYNQLIAAQQKKNNSLFN